MVKECADAAVRRGGMSLWGTAKLHPAPLSRGAVERIAAERTTLLR
jgi:hypothetical protein